MRIFTIVIGMALTTAMAVPMLAQDASGAPPQGEGAPESSTQKKMVYLKPDKMIEELDTNKDGCVSKAEWLAGGLPASIYPILEGQAEKRDCVTGREMTKGTVDAAIDTDGDGYLTVSEMKAYIAKNPVSDPPAGGPGAGGPGGGPSSGGDAAGGPGADAPGQQGGAPPAGAEGGAQKAGGSRYDEINKAVGLNPEQQTKVKAITDKSENDVHALQKSMPTWNAESKAAIDKIWARERAAILAVLDSKQKPKYEAYFKNWTEERAKDKH